MVHDARTFHWLLTEQNNIYKKGVKNYGIGGGNFLMTLGLFSVVDLLAQYNWILNKGYQAKSESKRIEKDLKKDENFKRARNVVMQSGHYLMIPKGIDHSEAFVELILEVFPEWDLGKDKLKEIWSLFRNKLTHMTYPNGLIGNAYTPGQNFKKAEDNIPITRNPFLNISSSEILINPLTLTRNIGHVLTTLEKKITDGQVKQERVGDLNNWLEENLDLWFREMA